jgi:hypothetical protein
MDGDNILWIRVVLAGDGKRVTSSERLMFRLKIRDLLEQLEDEHLPLLSFVDTDEFDERAVA